MSPNPSPEDMDIAVRWIDGELEGGERLEFELRLAAEPDLARVVEELAATDDWMRQHGAQAALDAPARESNERSAADHALAEPTLLSRRIAPWLALAAAAVAIVFAERFVFRGAAVPPQRAVDFTAGVVESFESAREFADRHVALAGLRPRGFEELRGDGAEPNVEPQQFLLATDDVLRELRERAGAETNAGYFTLPIAIPPDAGPSEVIAVAIPEVGREQLLVPGPVGLGGFGAPLAPSALVLDPGEHWLPRAPFELANAPGGVAEVRYSPGFLVPLGARSLAVLVGVRPSSAPPAPIDPLGELREVNARAPEVARWKRLLETAGFTVQELTVREP